MKLNRTEYQQMLKKESPPSPLGKDMLWAGVIGGLICTVGEAVSAFYQARGLDTEAAATATAITMVFLGALLTGLHVYDKIAKLAGAGTLVPITGFANSVAAPAIEYKKEGQVMGIGCKIFTIAGPVILYGTVISWALGLVWWIGSFL